MRAAGPRERALGALLRVAAAIPPLVLLAMIGVFGVGGAVAWAGSPELTLARPLLGTLLVVVIALAIAAPLGLLAATYLSELARPVERRVLRPLLAAFASVPGVALGWAALVIVAPTLRARVPGLPAPELVAAGVVIGAMSIPLVSSLAEDALAAVPRALREAGWALGGSTGDVILRVVWPAARAGLVAAVLLAAARAVGETMIVWIATGHGATLSALMAERSSGALGPVLMLGVVLLAITSALNLFAHRLVRRVRTWT